MIAADGKKRNSHIDIRIVTIQVVDSIEENKSQLQCINNYQKMKANTLEFPILTLAQIQDQLRHMFLIDMPCRRNKFL